MSFSSMMQSGANKAYKYAKEPGNMFLMTGIVGWILSSAAQVTAVVVNPKISKDQKKFLIPQEMADAVVNITAFYFFTKHFTNFGVNFVKTGRLATKELRNLYKNEKIGGKTIESLIGTKVSVLKKDGSQKLKDFDISELREITDSSDPKNFKSGLSEKYFHFADGVAFISSVVGSIISCNIVTPIARNKIAAIIQKHSIAKDNVKNDLNVPISPVLPAQNRFSIDNYKAKTMSSGVISGGSMRV